LLTLTVQESRFRSELGTRQLSCDEIDQILHEGVRLWLRAYRVRD
jgi:hypothetical protein